MAAADEVVFVSANLRLQFGGRGRVIPNGVSVDRIRAALQNRDSVRKEYRFGSDFVVLFVGRVTEDKGIRTLLSAFEGVRAAGFPIRLLLVGPVDPAMRGEVDMYASRAAAGALLILGARDDPYPFFAAADVFVLPSQREGLPLSLLEAMAAGLPVIASNVGGVPEVVDGQTGILLLPGDVIGFKEGILRLYEHREDAAAMAERARLRIAELYDFESVWKSYREIYGSGAESTT